MVGYSNKALRDGYKMVSASFLDVGTETVNINSISPSGVEEGASADQVYVQVLNAAGTTGPVYQWIDLPEEGLEAGWYNEDTEKVEDVTFNPGAGLWVSASDGIGLNFSGEVDSKVRTVPLRDGYTAAGNMMAIPVDINAIMPLGVEEGASADQIYIQILNAAGTTGPVYQWIDLPDEGLEAGWYNEDTEKVEDGVVVFEPGDGMWVSGSDGLFLEFEPPAL